MEQCRCTKEGDIAILQSEVSTLKNIHSTILELTINVTRLVEQMRETKDDVKSIKEDVEDLKTMPAKSYNHYKQLAVGVIISSVISFMIGKLL